MVRWFDGFGGLAVRWFGGLMVLGGLLVLVVWCLSLGCISCRGWWWDEKSYPPTSKLCLGQGMVKPTTPHSAHPQRAVAVPHGA